MLKILLILYVVSNIYENIFSNNGSGTYDIRELVENQLYREDQLRSQCNLGNYVIKPKREFYETVYEDFKYFVNEGITAKFYKNVYPALYGSENYIIECETYQEFINYSHNSDYDGRNLSYRGNIFTVSNSKSIMWSTQMNGLSLDIINVY